MNIAILKEVIQTLAELIKSKDKAEYILTFSDKDLIDYDLSGSPKLMWFKILKKAKNSAGGIMPIVKCALGEYPDNELLKSLLPSEHKANVNELNAPFSNILKNLNHETLGEISRVNCNRNNALKEYYKATFSKCNITYVVGTSKDNPNHFVERIILEHQGPTSDQTGKQSSIWSYRNRTGDNRIDEIPFTLTANIDISLNNFKNSIENSFTDINVDNIVQYFQMHQYKEVFISINYEYDLGNDILEEFTKEVYSIFNKKTETRFHIFFILTSVKESRKVIEHYNLIKNSLSLDQLCAIEAVSPALEQDINSWKSLVGLDSYTSTNFIEDLEKLKIPIEEINNYRGSKKIRMKYMEIFQNHLYDSFHKQK